MNDDIKEEAFSQLDKTQSVMFATDENGQPRLRPVTLAYIWDRFWITTFTGSEKIKQISSNPRTELCWLKQQKGDKDIYLRIAGQCKIIKDIDVKKQIADQLDFFSYYFKNVEDPNYTLVEVIPDELEYLKEGEYPAKKYNI
jgi:general stress protein 26